MLPPLLIPLRAAACLWHSRADTSLRKRSRAIFRSYGAVVDLSHWRSTTKQNTSDASRAVCECQVYCGEQPVSPIWPKRPYSFLVQVQLCGGNSPELRATQTTVRLEPPAFDYVPHSTSAHKIRTGSDSDQPITQLTVSRIGQCTFS